MAAPAAANVFASREWEQAEEAANTYVVEDGYYYTSMDNSPLTMWEMLLEQAGRKYVDPETMGLSGLMTGFRAYMAVHYPQFDHTAAEFKLSNWLAEARLRRDQWRSVPESVAFVGFTKRMLLYPDVALSYLPRTRLSVTELGTVVELLDEMEESPGTLTVQQRAGLPAMRPALRDIWHVRRFPREAPALSRVADVMNVRLGPHLTQSIMSRVHNSVGLVPPQRPFPIRTHLAEIKRIRDELAAGIGMTPQQLLARINTAKRDLDEVIESGEDSKKSKRPPPPQ